MTSEPDPALTGAAFVLANAGYRAMPEQDKQDEKEAIGGDSGSLREVAERRSGPRNDAVVRQYIDATGKVAAPQEAVTLQRAARDYARAGAADKLAAEDATSKEIAARVDALRAKSLAGDSDPADARHFEALVDPADNQYERPDVESTRADPTRTSAEEAAADSIPISRRPCSTRRSFKRSKRRSAKPKRPAGAISTDWRKPRNLRS